MSGFSSFGKALILFGIFIVIAGVILLLWDKIPFLGKLPGDIHTEKGDFQLYFSLVSSIVISLVLTAIINLILFIIRLLGK